MAKPTSSYAWATDSTWDDPGTDWHGLATKVEPAALRAQGHRPYPLAANHVNWQFATIAEWLAWLEARAASIDAGDTMTVHGSIQSDDAYSPPRIVFNGATGDLTINSGGDLNVNTGGDVFGNTGSNWFFSSGCTISSAAAWTFSGGTVAIDAGTWTIDPAATVTGRITKGTAALGTGGTDPDQNLNVDTNSVEYVYVFGSISATRTYTLGNTSRAPRPGDSITFVLGASGGSTTYSIDFAAATGSCQNPASASLVPELRRAANYCAAITWTFMVANSVSVWVPTCHAYQ